MSELWRAVDRYLTDLLAPPGRALESALAASDAAGLPPISVAPNQGSKGHDGFAIALVTPDGDPVGALDRTSPGA